MATEDNIVVIGAGIIGLATAYYLSLSPTVPSGSIHIIEASPELFACASGRAGGLIAKDWADPGTASLSALSFRLHKELAEEHGGREKWGYSASIGVSMMGKNSSAGLDLDWLMEGWSRALAAPTTHYPEGQGPDWLTHRNGDRTEVISERDSLAQVEPLRLCQFLLEQLLKQGVNLHHPAKATSVFQSQQGGLAGVHLSKSNEENVTLPCSRLVITAGPWTARVFSTLFPSGAKLPVSPLAGHSLTVKTPRWGEEHEVEGCHAVFTTEYSGFSPEIFSRLGSQIYVAGLNDPSLPLPELATEVQPDPKALATLRRVSQELLSLQSGGDDLEVTKESLCFRPITDRSTPFVCRVPDSDLGMNWTQNAGHDGVFIGVGHGPWGVSQSLGTGKVLAEMVEGHTPSADITKLSL